MLHVNRRLTRQVMPLGAKVEAEQSTDQRFRLYVFLCFRWPTATRRQTHRHFVWFLYPTTQPTDIV